MRLVKVEWNDEWRGYWLDPSAYLAELPKLSETMPPGAARYALGNGHYDFGSSQCVKGLWLSKVCTTRHGEKDLEIRFDPHEGKPNTSLMIEYALINRLDIVVGEHSFGLGGLGSVLLDELLPLESGCSHEIALVGGRIYIECADLQASWVDSS